MSDTYVRLPDDTLQAISDQLEAQGWDPEYVTEYEIKMTFPDRATGHAVQFSEFWLSWHMVDGRLAFGVGDDYGASEGRTRLDWRAPLDIEADASPQAVAVAADRAMHWLWHCDERASRRELHEKIRLLSDMQRRMQELGRRMLVTPAMIRDALKPSERLEP